MINVLGENYFVDLDEIEQFLNMDAEIDIISGTTESRINIIKFEMVKMLMEVLLTESSDIDDKLGMKSNDLSVPFKLAFNTLLNKKLINHY